MPSVKSLEPELQQDNPEQQKAALAKQIGERIASARKTIGRELGETKYGRGNFADYLGIKEPTLKNYESVLMPPSVQFLCSLYLYTGFTPSWICLGLEPRRVEPKPIPESSETSPTPPVRLTRFRASGVQPPSLLDRKQAARIAAQILLEFAGDS